MPDLPAGLSQDELRLRIRNERRVDWLREDAILMYAVGATRRRPGCYRPPGNGYGNYKERQRYLYHGKDGRETEGSIIPISSCRYPYLAEANRMLSITGTSWQNPG